MNCDATDGYRGSRGALLLSSQPQCGWGLRGELEIGGEHWKRNRMVSGFIFAEYTHFKDSTASICLSCAIFVLLVLVLVLVLLVLMLLLPVVIMAVVVTVVLVVVYIKCVEKRNCNTNSLRSSHISFSFPLLVFKPLYKYSLRLLYSLSECQGRALLCCQSFLCYCRRTEILYQQFYIFE